MSVIENHPGFERTRRANFLKRPDWVVPPCSWYSTHAQWHKAVSPKICERTAAPSTIIVLLLSSSARTHCLGLKFRANTQPLFRTEAVRKGGAYASNLWYIFVPEIVQESRSERHAWVRTLAGP